MKKRAVSKSRNRVDKNLRKNMKQKAGHDKYSDEDMVNLVKISDDFLEHFDDRTKHTENKQRIKFFLTRQLEPGSTQQQANKYIELLTEFQADETDAIYVNMERVRGWIRESRLVTAGKKNKTNKKKQKKRKMKKQK